ncbi:MAG: hypothetical protein JXB39_07225 [Deltaproteobacteria bacterium]|nr:hypothetical protein [Deltaproteobacteria bacterium]
MIALHTSSGERTLEPSARRPADALLASAVVLALGLGVLVAGLRTHRSAPPALEARLEAVDVARAADVLSAEVGRRSQEIGAALLPGEEAALVDLLRLQAEAADLVLGDVRFATLPREGLVQPVEVVLDVEGACHDVPLFVDGLFRQSRVVEVRSIALEAAAPMAARIRARMEARLWRPYVVDATTLGPLLAVPSADPSTREFTTQALASVAALEAWEAFDRMLPAMQERASENRRLVLRTLLTLVRRLPGSPMDWVGATFEGAKAQIAYEPAPGLPPGRDSLQ